LARLVLLGLALSLLALSGTNAQPTRPSPAEHAQRVAGFQQNLNREFRDPRESPLPAAERGAFQGLPFYPVDYQYCVLARLERDSTAQPFAMPTSTGRRPPYRKYGILRFTLAGQALALSVYESLDLAQKPGFADYLLVPFTDLSNGHGSYGGGRYLDLRQPPPGTQLLLLDFNQAYNPSCAYSPNYSCPIPPPENRLSVAVEAGVRSDH